MSCQTFCYNAYKTGNCESLELKKFELNKDDRGYYLSAAYRVEDKHSIREIDIPKIRLYLDDKRITVKIENDPCLCHKVGYVNLGFGEVPLDWDMNENGLAYLFTEKIIEEKYTEMTLDEIEKKLGHKVKIVNK